MNEFKVWWGNSNAYGELKLKDAQTYHLIIETTSMGQVVRKNKIDGTFVEQTVRLATIARILLT